MEVELRENIPNNRGPMQDIPILAGCRKRKFAKTLSQSGVGVAELCNYTPFNSVIVEAELREMVPRVGEAELHEDIPLNRKITLVNVYVDLVVFTRIAGSS